METKCKQLKESFSEFQCPKQNSLGNAPVMAGRFPFTTTPFTHFIKEQSLSCLQGSA